MNSASLSLGLVQMCSQLDVEANIAFAHEQIARAADAGARVVVLPELFPCYGDLSRAAAVAQSIDGPWIDQLRTLAREKNIWLIAGSIPETSPTPGKAFNTCIVLSPAGEVVAAYRKIHLFDVQIAGRVASQESEHLLPGSEIVTFEIDGWKVGLAICYDLRFPELFRALASQGARLIIVPAAFTRTTGKDHWELLVRTRALDAQAYIAAANQTGDHTATSASFGHSMIVDPWGEVVNKTNGDSPALVIATIDQSRVEQVRTGLPVLANRRLQDGGFATSKPT